MEMRFVSTQLRHYMDCIRCSGAVSTHRDPSSETPGLRHADAKNIADPADPPKDLWIFWSLFDVETIKDQHEGVFLSTASSFCNFSTSTGLSFMTYQLDCKLCSSASEADIEHRVNQRY